MVEYFRRRAVIAAIIAGLIAIAGVFVLRSDARYIFDGLTSRALPLVIISSICGIGSLVLLVRNSQRGARVLAIGAVASIVIGWGVAQWPYMFPETLKVSQAAAPDPTLVTILVVFIVAAIVILPSLDSVDRVVRGPKGVLDSTRPDTVVLQMSTISPPLTRALGEAAAARSIGFLDTPMSGTASMVAKGDCTIFVGGDAALTERCRPVFEAIATRFVHVGAVGDACLAKLAMNLLVGLNTVAVAEALVLGVKGGLDPARLLDVLRQSAGSSRMVEVRGPLMVERRFEPQMKTELFLKDFHLMLDDQSDQLFAMIDPVAERTRKLGGTSLHSIGDISRHQRLPDNDLPDLAAEAMLKELLLNNEELTKYLRSTHEICDRHNDVATASLLENWIDETEQRTWFLFEAARR
jgi:3-hydroxyisobutyrate dehydrogenase-like beta-hydroxyacid dehydrogenase